MSVVDTSAVESVDHRRGVFRVVRFWTQRVEPLLERWSERLNPILVKEARQSLKSRQFSITFALLLICAWGWSMIGVFAKLPEIYYRPEGASVLIGYYVILAIPLLVVVPFISYRSLAAEREDGTFELLSISALSSRQIVLGKLCSALLQMTVYYSALAPCIAFTYMLRGVSILFITVLLLYTFVASTLLSCVGLVVAGIARARHWQGILSVFMLLALALVIYNWLYAALEIIERGRQQLPFDQWEFWLSQLVVLTCALSYIVLLIEIAAAQNSFESDNRSTRVRAAMTMQTLAYVGWAAYLWAEYGEIGGLVVPFYFATVHWVVYAAFLTGESSQLSPRVQRGLPRTVAGRWLFSWYNPGSGSGYFFALAHVLLIASATGLAIVIQSRFSLPVIQFPRPGFDAQCLTSLAFVCCYFAFYLGLGRLIFLMIPHRSQHGVVLPVLIHFFVILVGALGPYMLASWYHRFRSFSYDTSQAFNWVWTIEQTLATRIQPEVWLMVLSGTAVVVSANLLTMRHELQWVRISAPDRVLADDQPADDSSTPAVSVHPLAE